MKRVFVQVWCEIDPTLNLRVDRPTGAAVADDGDLLTRVSPLGRFGVTEALRIGDDEVTAFALGEAHDDALRLALAAGASRAMRLRFEGEFTDATVVACLAGWLSAQNPDLIIADRLAGRLAARLGWAHLAGIDHVQIENGVLSAVRHLGRGACESVTARIPAVVRLQSESPRIRYISRARLDRVVHSPIEQTVLQASNQPRQDAEVGPLQISRPRTRLGAAPAAAPAKAMDRLNALMGIGGGMKVATPKAPEPTRKTPEQMAEEFLRYLAHHNLLNDS